MSEQRDKFLTEAMGECWHDFDCPEDVLTEKFYTGTFAHLQYCYKCKHGVSGNNDFSDWSGFGKLWEWSQKQEWWIEFNIWLEPWRIHELIHPEKFADVVYQFLKEERG